MIRRARKRNIVTANQSCCRHVSFLVVEILDDSDATAAAGNAKPKPATVAKIADALRIDVRELSRWIGQTREVAKPYTPPSEADLLDQRERDALDEIIRVMAASKIGVKPEDETSQNQPLRVVRPITASPPIAASRRNKETRSD